VGEASAEQPRAFTGATQAKPGLVEMADGGTLFIDEIAEMAPGLQAKLLRVLENGHYRRVRQVVGGGVSVCLMEEIRGRSWDAARCVPLSLLSLLLAGGGYTGGIAYGQTDDFGYQAIADRVSVPSLHATILHQLGLDHRRVHFTQEGREESLTDARATRARVVGELLAQPVQARG